MSIVDIFTMPISELLEIAGPFVYYYIFIYCLISLVAVSIITITAISIMRQRIEYGGIRKRNRKRFTRKL